MASRLGPPPGRGRYRQRRRRRTHIAAHTSRRSSNRRSGASVDDHIDVLYGGAQIDPLRGGVASGGLTLQEWSRRVRIPPRCGPRRFPPNHLVLEQCARRAQRLFLESVSASRVVRATPRVKRMMCRGPPPRRHRHHVALSSPNKDPPALLNQLAAPPLRDSLRFVVRRIDLSVVVPGAAGSRVEADVVPGELFLIKVAGEIFDLGAVWRRR